jgi:excinuclease ABC subunit C
MEKFKFLSKKRIYQLPKVSGVYCFKNGKEILYIGKAVNLRERVKNHFQQPSFKDYLFLDRVEKVGYIKTNSEIEALILESELIKKYQPRFNVVWRDSKNFFFVAITKEDFPKIFLTHQKKIKNQKSKVEIEYLGPFVDGKALKKTLYLLRKIFPYYSTKKHPEKKCQWCHLNLCPGPKADKKEYQKNIKNLIEILKGKRQSVLKELKKEMIKMAKSENFEKAAKLRDQILALEKILNNSRVIKREIKPEIPWEITEKTLKKILKVEKVSRIEAFDISQLHGNFAVGSMITFINGIPDKNLYRRFKIKFTKKPSDVDMIREILRRRFKHKEWGFPDLILIDGGKAQLNAAIQIKNKNSKIKNKIKVISLAKPENKLFIEKEKESIFLEKLPREIFKLILNLNSEAHRFAIFYHRKLRERGLIPKV